MFDNDPAARTLALDWLRAAASGDVRTLQKISTRALLDDLTTQAGGTAPRHRIAMRLGLSRRFEHLDFDRCGILSASRPIGPNLETIVVVHDRENVHPGSAFPSSEAELIHLELTDDGWRVAGFSGGPPAADGSPI